MGHLCRFVSQAIQLVHPLHPLSHGEIGRAKLGHSCVQDEPTNHLDLPSILWLQGYLKALDDRTIVVVSHDRAFLDEVAQETILLRHSRLAYHAGRCMLIANMLLALVRATEDTSLGDARTICPLTDLTLLIAVSLWASAKDLIKTYVRRELQ